MINMLLLIISIIGTELPDNIAGYWVFTDDLNFNTGYPKSSLISLDLEAFSYDLGSIKSIAPSLTGTWAPLWNSDNKGEIWVHIIF